jgi:hypothetical protein
MGIWVMRYGLQQYYGQIGSLEHATWMMELLPSGPAPLISPQSASEVFVVSFRRITCVWVAKRLEFVTSPPVHVHTASSGIWQVLGGLVIHVPKARLGTTSSVNNQNGIRKLHGYLHGHSRSLTTDSDLLPLTWPTVTTSSSRDLAPASL